MAEMKYHGLLHVVEKPAEIQFVEPCRPVTLLNNVPRVLGEALKRLTKYLDLQATRSCSNRKFHAMGRMLLECRQVLMLYRIMMIHKQDRGSTSRSTSKGQELTRYVKSLSGGEGHLAFEASVTRGEAKHHGTQICKMSISTKLMVLPLFETLHRAVDE